MGTRREVVLVGGGHAHVQVLRRWAMAPPPDVRVTVVVDRAVAAYSGMVPALVAGEVARHEVEIDVRPLARRAGARFVEAAATRIDADAQRIAVQGRPSIPYDLASLDIGSTVAGLDVPGVAEHAVPTRPIGRFMDRLLAKLEGLGAGTPARVVVVGAGAGGVELAATLQARLSAERPVDVTLVGAGPDLLPGAPWTVRRAVRNALARRGIDHVAGTRVVSVAADHVALDDDRRLPADVVVWVTGAQGHAVARASDLPVDARGFLRVRSTLQVEGHYTLLAAGDCAFLVDDPWVPRAGVYAVREGPYVADNLEALLSGHAPRAYRPQRDFLSMLNLGDGTAIASKWGVPVRGRWVHRWKDRIDRQFMDRFQVLGPDGSPDTPFGDDLPPMPMDDVRCGGCAAKVGPAALDDLLATAGVARGGDAARVDVGGAAVVVSSDGFPPFTDDPFLVGRVAAAHALRDLHAAGARPTHAQILLTVPLDDPDAGPAALAGVRAGLADEGVVLTGGHTAEGEGLFVGLTAFGEPARPGFGGAGARPGDAWILTGPLGGGVLWRADMVGAATGPAVAAWVDAATRPMGPVLDALDGLEVHAATDVTGFGLLGHLAACLDGTDMAATIAAASVPAFGGVRAALARGWRSTAHPANAAGVAERLAVRAGADEADVALALDPQTAGPLLLAVPAPDAGRAVQRLRAAGCAQAAIVGHAHALAGGARVTLVPR